MAEQLTVKQVHAMLGQYLHNRSDLGVWNAVAMRVMGPRNLFDPESVRKRQPWFVLFSTLSLAALGASVYFNLWN